MWEEKVQCDILTDAQLVWNWFQPTNRTQSLWFYLNRENRWFRFKRNEEDVLCKVVSVTFQFVCLHKSKVGHAAIGMEAFQTAPQTFLLGSRV